jgi:hypothetical protein
MSSSTPQRRRARDGKEPRPRVSMGMRGARVCRSSGRRGRVLIPLGAGRELARRTGTIPSTPLLRGDQIWRGNEVAGMLTGGCGQARRALAEEDQFLYRWVGNRCPLGIEWVERARRDRLAFRKRREGHEALAQEHEILVSGRRKRCLGTYVLGVGSREKNKSWQRL